MTPPDEALRDALHILADVLADLAKQRAPRAPRTRGAAPVVEATETDRAFARKALGHKLARRAGGRL